MSCSFFCVFNQHGVSSCADSVSDVRPCLIYRAAIHTFVATVLDLWDFATNKATVFWLSEHCAIPAKIVTQQTHPLDKKRWRKKVSQQSTPHLSASQHFFLFHTCFTENEWNGCVMMCMMKYDVWFDDVYYCILYDVQWSSRCKDVKATLRCLRPLGCALAERWTGRPGWPVR